MASLDEQVMIELYGLTRPRGNKNLRDALAGCPALLAMFHQLLGVPFDARAPQIGPASLLTNVLSGYANFCRRRFLDDPELAGQDREDVISVIAAAELLGLTNEKHFQEKLKRLGTEKQQKGRRALANADGVVQPRQIRAAVWAFDNYSERAMRGSESQKRVLIQFRDRFRWHLEQPEHAEKLRARLQALVPAEAASPPEDWPEPGSSIPKPPRPDVFPPVETSLRGVIDGFSAVVRRWLEVRRRGVAESDFLPVRWTTMNEDPHFDRWENIRGDGHDEPLDLDGEFARIAEVFESLPHRRLVVLGPGGAGKTELVVELAWRLRERSAGRGIVPVVFQASTWNPRQQSFESWIVSRLIADYPSLRPSRRNDPASQLVEGGHVLPILDGFDEMAPGLHTKAINELNKWSRCGGALVLTSRPTAYFDAIDHGEHGEYLQRAPGVKMEQLRLQEVKDYLRLSPFQGSWEKWEPIFAQFDYGDRSPEVQRVAETLSRPLMAFLAREIYRRREASPRELLDFDDTAAIEAHLVAGLVPAVYKDSDRYQVEKAQRYLGFLATVLVAENTSEFAWWKENPTQIGHRIWRVTGMFLIFGFSLVGVSIPIAGSLRGALAEPTAMVGEIFVLLFLILAIALGSRRTRQPRRLQPSAVRTKSLGERIDAAAMDGEIAFRIAVISLLPAFLIGIILESWPLFLLALVLVLVPRIVSFPGSADISSPRSLFRADLVSALVQGGSLIVGMVLTGAASWLVTGDPLPTNSDVFYLSMLAFFWAALQSASVVWILSNTTVALRKDLPVRGLSFFDDARTKGVLRLSGGTYQFRHAFLQVHLAHWYVEKYKRPDSAVYWDTRIVLWQYKSDRSTASKAVGDLRRIAEEQRREGNPHNAVQAWHFIIEITQDAHGVEAAIQELFALQKSDLDVSGRLYYQTQRILIELLRDKGDLEEAKNEWRRLRKVIEKQERRINPDHSFPARSFWDELRKNPITGISDESDHR